MYALISGGVVVSVTTAQPVIETETTATVNGRSFIGLTNPQIDTCDDGVGIGYSFVDGAFWPPLKQALALALAQLQKAKTTALASMPYTLNGTTYQVTLSAQDQLDVANAIALLTAQGAGATMPWEIVNNVFLTWAVTDVQALQAAGSAYVTAVYANAAVLAAQINAAVSASALGVINIQSGWPT